MIKTILAFGFLLSTIFIFGQEIKYVKAEKLNIRSGAGTEYEVVAKIMQGQKVKVFSNSGKWSIIEIENGTKGFVSTKFLSNITNTKSPNSKKESSWIGYIIAIGLLFYVIKKIKNFLLGSTTHSLSNSNSQRITSIEKQKIKKSYNNSAVYKFRVKGNGSIGGLKYIDGMNVEVAVSGLGSSGSPFNTMVEKLFVEEFAKKYNVTPNLHSTVKLLFRRANLDVEEL